MARRIGSDGYMSGWGARKRKGGRKEPFTALPDLPGGLWRLGLYRADLEPWLALGFSEGLRGTALVVADPAGEHRLELPIDSLEEFEDGWKYPEAWLDLWVVQHGTLVMLKDPTDQYRTSVRFLGLEEQEFWRCGSGGEGEDDVGGEGEDPVGDKEEDPIEPIAVGIFWLSDIQGTFRATVMVNGGRADRLGLPPGRAGQGGRPRG